MYVCENCDLVLPVPDAPANSVTTPFLIPPSKKLSRVRDIQNDVKINDNIQSFSDHSVLVFIYAESVEIDPGG